MVSQWLVVLALAACAFAVAAASNVRQCPGQSIAGLTDDVKLSSCNQVPCKLRQRTTQNITIKFTLEKDAPDVTNHVSADLFGIQNAPFTGVDGSSICNQVFKESGEVASCPLQAGVKYTYIDYIHVYIFYPRVTVTVHWELKDKEITVSCFEVDVTILTPK